MSRILGQEASISRFNRHLNGFVSEARAAVLEKTGQERRWFSRFRKPLLQPFVILTGLAEGSVEGVRHPCPRPPPWTTLVATTFASWVRVPPAVGARHGSP